MFSSLNMYIPSFVLVKQHLDIYCFVLLKYLKIDFSSKLHILRYCLSLEVKISLKSRFKTNRALLDNNKLV